MPGIPYTTNKRGFGPAWTNSLFENNAELALGMFLSVKQQRQAQKTLMEAYAAEAGLDRLTIGVEAAEARNLAIYLHWGYTEFVYSETDCGELILYYAKNI